MRPERRCGPEALLEPALIYELLTLPAPAVEEELPGLSQVHRMDLQPRQPIRFDAAYHSPYTWRCEHKGTSYFLSAR